ncbi:hypothetical protein PU02_1171 [Bartonella ancashensis]|uniref:Uncharacterized protein n=1 Tax=Bartonella ancashensis TaxID=1318743 RepID=A0A0M3T374_9HYPH|nr:hypothetical protein PU02_1171 [Bartonella ancashensis]
MKPSMRSSIQTRLPMTESAIFIVIIDMILNITTKTTTNVVINAIILLEIYGSTKGNKNLNEKNVMIAAIIQDVKDRISREKPRTIAKKDDNKIVTIIIPSKKVIAIFLLLSVQITFYLQLVQQYIKCIVGYVSFYFRSRLIYAA